MAEAQVLKSMLKKFANGDLLLLSEASQILNLPENYLLSAIKDGRLGAFRVGDNWFVEERQLNIFRFKINQYITQELLADADEENWSETIVSSDFYLLIHNSLRFLGRFSSLTLVGVVAIVSGFVLSIFFYQVGQDYRQAVKNFDQQILLELASWEQKQQRFNDEAITRVLMTWNLTEINPVGRVLGEVEGNNLE